MPQTLELPIATAISGTSPGTATWSVTVRRSMGRKYRYRCDSLDDALALAETVRQHWPRCHVALMRTNQSYRHSLAA